MLSRSSWRLLWLALLASPVLPLLVACGQPGTEPTTSTTSGGSGGGGGGSGGRGGNGVQRELAAIPTESMQRAPMHTARDGHTATLLPDGRVLVIGGESLAPSREMIDAVELYDPGEDSWTDLPPLPQPRCNHTATLLSDGTVLIVGGGKSNGVGLPSGLEVRAEALLYDPATGSIESLGPNLVPRHGHHAVRLPSGKVLLVGGAGNESTVKPAQGNSNPQPFGNALASAEIYDPGTRAFEATGSLAEARYAFGAVSLADGRVLASGGAHYQQEATSLATSEIFDEASGAFEPAGTFDGSDRLFLTETTLADGRVLVFGGKKSNVTFLDDTQIFDPETSTWVAGTALPPTRTASASVATEEGGALVIGGLSCSAGGCDTPPQVDVWHPDGSASPGPTLHDGHGNGTATVLQDGTVLVVGGYSTVGSIDSVELLVP